MIGKIISFILGFLVGTFFGWAILNKLIELLMSRIF